MPTSSSRIRPSSMISLALSFGLALALLATGVAHADTYVYFRCNATGWGADSTTRMRDTGTPGVVAVEFDVKSSWMTTSGDDCELTQTNALDGWGTQTSYYAFGTTGFVFQAPGAQQTSLVSGIDPHFKIRYGSLRRYRALFDRNTLKLTIDTGPPEVPTDVIRDLGGMNTPVLWEASGGVFQITGLPSAGFNVVTLRIEARDGKPLAGELAAGGGTVALTGSSQTIRFRERGSLPVVFQLSFPASRRIALSWQVEDRVPASKAVSQTPTLVGSNHVSVYHFTDDHAVATNLTLTFPVGTFSDGNTPSYTRFEHNPQGVRYPTLPDEVFGPTFDISARLAWGRRVQIALPVPEVALSRGLDESFATVMHYNDATKTWSEIIPDRVADGYIYFTTDSCSKFFTRLKKAVKKAVSEVKEAVLGAAEKVYDTVVTIVDNVRDNAREVFAQILADPCSALEFSTYKHLFFGKPTFQAPQANLADIVGAITATDLGQLRGVDGRDLRLLSMAASTAAARCTTCCSATAVAADIEADEWTIGRENALLLLNDIVLSAAESRPRRFSLSGPVAGDYTISDNRTSPAQTYLASQLFRFSSPLMASAPGVLNTLITCGGALGIGDEVVSTVNHAVGVVRDVTRIELGGACRNLLGLTSDAVDWVVPDVVECALVAASFATNYTNNNLGQYWMKTDCTGRDAHFLDASDFFNVFTVLLWADAGLRQAMAPAADVLRDELHAFIGMFHKFYGNNNIPIKAMAGVSLWDMLSRGEKGTYASMKAWMEGKTSDQGGYSEGTGYLQYMNADVPYILSVMLRAGFIQRSELPQKYLKTGEWLFNLANHADDRVPAEVDDGHVWTPDFRVYAFLTGDGRYSTLGSGPQNGFTAMGLTSVVLPVSASPVLPNVYFGGGVGAVRATVGTTTASMRIIAESGFLRTEGNGHDQQDNMSVTMKRGLADVIIDPGYSGHGKRNENMCPRFDNHNVVMTEAEANFHGEATNGKLTFQQLIDALKDLDPGLHANLTWLEAMGAGGVASLTMMQVFLGRPLAAGLTWSALVAGWDTLKNMEVDPTDVYAGGADANLLGFVDNSAAVPSYGLEVMHTSTAGVTNRRLVLAFADHLWIIDRPAVQRALLSRLNWASDTEFNNSAHLAERIPSPAGQIVTIGQKDEVPTRTPYQVTVGGGSNVDLPPVFVTAVPVANVDSPFEPYGCYDGNCMRRTTPAGVDLVIVPNWGTPFIDGGQFFGTNLVTGKVVLAHRDAGSTTWRYRLVGAEGATTSEYVFEAGPLTWPQARDACLARGAHLASIGSQPENALVQGVAAGVRHVWIGLNKQGGNWQWVDGSSGSYRNWMPGEPNNSGNAEIYVEMRPDSSGRWNDLPSTWQLPYVCERN